MCPECNSPLEFFIPWEIHELNKTEKQEFMDYVKNNIEGNGKNTYVSLRHVKVEENNGHPPFFIIPPYASMTIPMPLPSMIEKYTIS